MTNRMPCRISDSHIQEPGDEYEPEDNTDWDSENKADRINERLEEIEARVRATRDNGV